MHMKHKTTSNLIYYWIKRQQLKKTGPVLKSKGLFNLSYNIRALMDSLANGWKILLHIRNNLYIDGWRVKVKKEVYNVVEYIIVFLVKLNKQYREYVILKYEVKMNHAVTGCHLKRHGSSLPGKEKYPGYGKMFLQMPKSMSYYWTRHLMQKQYKIMSFYLLSFEKGNIICTTGITLFECKATLNRDNAPCPHAQSHQSWIWCF